MAKHYLWGAVSRALRSPSRANNDIELDLHNSAGSGLPVAITYFGSNETISEEALSYEGGYRWKYSPQLAFDLSVFYNKYNDLTSAEAGAPYLGSNFDRIIVPLTFANRANASTYGGDFAIDWKPLPVWHLQASYSLLDLEAKLDPGSLALNIGENGNSPKNQALLKSFLDLPYNLELDSVLRYVDSLPTPNIDSYLELDLRLGWKVDAKWSLALIGSNLLESSHAEYTEQFSSNQARSVERTIYGVVTYKR